MSDMRKDAALARLTEEQKAELFDWLSTGTYEAVRARLAKPAPEGFGIRTHINSLQRFYSQYSIEIRARDFADAAVASGSLPQSSIDSAVKASQAAFAHATYLLSHAPMTGGNYRAIGRALRHHEDSLLKRQYLDLAREYVVIARERLRLDRAEFEYNAARAALSVLPELVAIDEMKNVDDEAKIWRVRDRLFGVGPGHVSTPSTNESPNEKTQLSS